MSEQTTAALDEARALFTGRSGVSRIGQDLIREVERLRGYLDTLRGMAGGLAEHEDMQAVIEEALAHDR